MAKRKNKQAQAIPEQPETYFQKRMAALGIVNTGDYGFEVESLEFHGTKSFFPLFAETMNGSIQINYPCLYGGAEPNKDGDGEFFRIRNNPANEPENKYWQEPGTGVHIFFPPSVIEKFEKAEKIDTLFCVEGEFKAFAGSQHGLDIVGLGGKDLFKDADKVGLHEDILAIIYKCDVQNVCLLLDADVHLISWDNPEEDPYKDLAERPNSFYSTVRTFREMAKGRVRDVYFSQVREKHLTVAKGLDDLLFVKRGDEESVTKDLLKLKAAQHYFECQNISNLSLNQIKGEFNLTLNKGVPAKFYFKHSHIIGEREFTFNGARYIFDKTQDGLTLTRHEDSKLYKRIGCDFMKEIQVPNERGVNYRKLIGWKSGEISRDYVQGMGIKNFFDTIEKYEAMCNVPENDPDKYQQVINNCYNMYFKLEHYAQEGKWPVTEKFLKHLFGERVLSSGYTNYELALDWLTIIYRYPVAKLPAICLVSAQKKTGKSTFLWWLQAIYNENATVIGNDEITDNNNDDYITKLIIGVDESFIEKRVIIEKIKSQITNPKAKFHGKYIARQDVPFIGKYVMTSNLETNFLMIDDDENRFWINKVPVFPKGEQDPDLLEKMKQEIPAFIHFLKEREILHPRKDRLWFESSLLDTDAAQAVKESSKGWLEKEIKATFKDMFFEYEYHTLYFSISEIMTFLNGSEAGVKFRKAAVTECLEEVFKYKNTMGRYDQPVHPDKISKAINSSKFEEKRGRLYTFKIEDFVKDDEIKKQFKAYSLEDISIFREEMGEALAAEEAAGGDNDDLPF